MPIIVPEYDLVAVFTGWNTLGSNKQLSHREAIYRVLRALVKPQAAATK